ncbi:MAG: 30S ribosomal protein S1 [Rhodospirillaceae bacterium]|nr:30S ribosomal protein S1 [Rhodospirillaceae bacterium]|tara:strand:+ start:6663 stop:8399 length:1737 start_codon:yes stop_codon:yes gene_type:complete
MSDTINTESQASKENEEDFISMLEESLATQSNLEGSVVKGTIVALENDQVVVDVGLKAEGRISLKEFSSPGEEPDISVGDSVEVYLDRIENRDGEAVLSREKARREEAWEKLEVAFSKGERVNGQLFGRVKGGFTVDLSGAVAFLPGSQVDVRPVKDPGSLMGQRQDFQILKMDRRRGNIVVSRRAVLEETRAEARNELLANLAEGQVLEGVVKNITDYGAFVDLGGIDGLLHVTDMAWKRISHPSELLVIGENVKVQVIKLNSETQRISLGIKQLDSDPWTGIEERFPIDQKMSGRVTNITDYGAFVEIADGVEGLVHVSEMSWTKKNVHPGKIVSTSQEVEVIILDIDMNKRRISLGLKQTMPNPWEKFLNDHPTGSEVEGQIKSITEFGLFIGFENDVDGLVHLSDISWDKPDEEAASDYKKGDLVKARVLDVSVEKERISLGIKQLSEDPFDSLIKNFNKGDTITCTIAGVKDSGIDVTLPSGISTFIRRSDLSRDKAEQRPERFATGDKLDAKIISLDTSSRRVGLSIKALEVAEEKEAMVQYGSSDSGASLGDILGAALKKNEDESESENKP